MSDESKYNDDSIAPSMSRGHTRGATMWTSNKDDVKQQEYEAKSPHVKQAAFPRAELERHAVDTKAKSAGPLETQQKLSQPSRAGAPGSLVPLQFEAKNDEMSIRPREGQGKSESNKASEDPIQLSLKRERELHRKFDSTDYDHLPNQTPEQVLARMSADANAINDERIERNRLLEKQREKEMDEAEARKKRETTPKSPTRKPTSSEMFEHGTGWHKMWQQQQAQLRGVGHRLFHHHDADKDMDKDKVSSERSQVREASVQEMDAQKQDVNLPSGQKQEMSREVSEKARQQADESSTRDLARSRDLQWHKDKLQYRSYDRDSNLPSSSATIRVDEEDDAVVPEASEEEMRAQERRYASLSDDEKAKLRRDVQQRAFSQIGGAIDRVLDSLSSGVNRIRDRMEDEDVVPEASEEEMRAQAHKYGSFSDEEKTRLRRDIQERAFAQIERDIGLSDRARSGSIIDSGSRPLSTSLEDITNQRRDATLEKEFMDRTKRARERDGWLQSDYQHDPLNHDSHHRPTLVQSFEDLGHRFMHGSGKKEAHKDKDSSESFKSPASMHDRLMHEARAEFESAEFDSGDGSIAFTPTSELDSSQSKETKKAAGGAKLSRSVTHTRSTIDPISGRPAPTKDVGEQHPVSQEFKAVREGRALGYGGNDNIGGEGQAVKQTTMQAQEPQQISTLDRSAKKWSENNHSRLVLPTYLPPASSERKQFKTLPVDHDEGLIGSVKEKLEDAKDQVLEWKDDAKTKLSEAKETVKEWKDEAVSKLEDIKDSASRKLAQVEADVENKTDEFTSNVKRKSEELKGDAKEKLQGVKEYLKEGASNPNSEDEVLARRGRILTPAEQDMHDEQLGRKERLVQVQEGTADTFTSLRRPSLKAAKASDPVPFDYKAERARAKQDYSNDGSNVASGVGATSLLGRIKSWFGSPSVQERPVQVVHDADHSTRILREPSSSSMRDRSGVMSRASLDAPTTPTSMQSKLDELARAEGLSGEKHADNALGAIKAKASHLWQEVKEDAEELKDGITRKGKEWQEEARDMVQSAKQEVQELGHTSRTPVSPIAREEDRFAEFEPRIGLRPDTRSRTSSASSSSHEIHDFLDSAQPLLGARPRSPSPSSTTTARLHLSQGASGERTLWAQTNTPIQQRDMLHDAEFEELLVETME